MTLIHIYPQVAGQAGKAIRREQVTAPENQDHAQEQHQDANMMYAWSIGVTGAARTLTNSPRYEECPPEVYIG